jgi:hypothetical protein
LGLPNLFVMNVTINEQHARNMIALLATLMPEGKSRLFIFKTMSTLGDFRKAPDPSPDMFTSAWLRAGYDPLDLTIT